MNVWIASVGRSTIGCPATLNDVLIRTGTLDNLANSLSSKCTKGSVSFETDCTLAVLSTCVIEGNLSRYSFLQ